MKPGKFGSCNRTVTLGGGSKYFFIFTPIFVEKWSNLTWAYFSNGLVQPPTTYKSWDVFFQRVELLKSPFDSCLDGLASSLATANQNSHSHWSTVWHPHSPCVFFWGGPRWGELGGANSQIAPAVNNLEDLRSDESLAESKNNRTWQYSRH